MAPGGTRLRVALLTVAVFDDLVALGVIAIVYTDHISMTALLVAAGLYAAIIALRYAPENTRRSAAAVLGVAFWGALHESGVDPIIAGLAVGLVTSAYPPPRDQLERVMESTRTFREQPTPQSARSAQRSVAAAISPNDRLQYHLHPWTSFVIVPLFALANAGIHIDGDLLKDAVSSPITLGIFFGYLVGKPVGLIAGAVFALTVGRGLRRGLTWPVITGGGIVAGIGFTVSLLIANLAFEGRELEEAKVGILASGIVAALLGWAAFRIIARLPTAVRARQLAGTAEELVDLAEDVEPGRDHIRGAGDATVTLVEYGDYECSYCGQAEVVIRELLQSFGGELRYVWRHLPLNDVHVHTQMAAEAAEAAAAQGQFWPMHDKLLDHQDELTPQDLDRYAREIGLDVDRFWREVEHHEHAGRIADDVGSADASGVAGTPSFFINGRRHEGAYDLRPSPGQRKPPKHAPPPARRSRWSTNVQFPPTHDERSVALCPPQACAARLSRHGYRDGAAFLGLRAGHPHMGVRRRGRRQPVQPDGAVQDVRGGDFEDRGGGEINCLDPGGFGGVTITKSITIKCHYTEGGVLVERDQRDHDQRGGERQGHASRARRQRASASGRSDLADAASRCCPRSRCTSSTPRSTASRRGWRSCPTSAPRRA